MAVKPVRYHFDRLLLWYLGGIFAITFVGSYYGPYYLITALAQLVLIFMVLRISGTSAVNGPRSWLRWLYPLILMMPLHYEVELVGTLFHSGAVYDQLVAGWDRWLFRGHPHRYLSARLSGPWWRELFHLLYLTYYPLALGGFGYAWWQGRRTGAWEGRQVSREFLRYAFVFLGTFLSYMVIFIAFPVVGPMDDRFLIFHGQGVLGPIIDSIFEVGDSAAGAMPSSHVGEAVVVYLLLRPRDRRRQLLFLAVIAGLTFAAVYCSLHYGVDVVAGLVSGPLLYLLWSWGYRRLSPEPIIIHD